MASSNDPSAHPSRELARFAATLQHTDIPAPVLRRTEDLFLDWMASVLAGKGARPVEAWPSSGWRRGRTLGPAKC